MTVRCLVPAAIFSVLFFCCSALADSPQTAGKSTLAEFSVPVRITVSEEEKAEQKRLLEQTREHDNSDLEAQWKSANAAEQSAYFSLMSALISGIVVITSVLTSAFSIYQTNKSIKNTVSIGQAQVRAYISVKDIELKFRETPAGRQVGKLNVTLKNYGASPARNIHAISSFITVPKENIGKVIDSLSKKEINEEKATHNLLPGDVTNMTQGLISDNCWASVEETTAFMQGDIGILVHCLIEYFDVFDVKYKTQYCRQAIYKTSDSSSPRIIYRTYEHHNSES